MFNNDLASKVTAAAINSVVPSDNNDTIVNYPAGLSFYSIFIGYKIKLSNIAFQEAPVPGLFFYSDYNNFQIHAYGIDPQYVGKEIWLYFILDK